MMSTPVLERSVRLSPAERMPQVARSTKYVPALSDIDAREYERLLKAIGDHTRLQLLSLLQKHGGEISVFELVAAFPLEQPTISHHLRILRDARLVECQKKGLWAYYSIRADAWEYRVQPVLQSVTTLFGERKDE